MRRHARAAALAVAFVVGAATSAARAAPCPVPAGADPRLGAVDGLTRLRWIDQRLDHEAGRGERWAMTWALGIGAGGIASLAPAPFVAPGDRVDWYTGAVTAVIGIVPLVVAPLSVVHDAPELRKAVKTLAPGNDAAECKLLADAEQKLANDGANETWQRRWWSHAGNVVFNTGVLLFLGLGFHHWTSGIINGASGVVVGEALILTQPTGAVDDDAAYRRGDVGTAADPGAAPRSLGLTWRATF